MNIKIKKLEKSDLGKVIYYFQKLTKMESFIVWDADEVDEVPDIKCADRIILSKDFLTIWTGNRSDEFAEEVARMFFGNSEVTIKRDFAHIVIRKVKEEKR